MSVTLYREGWTVDEMFEVSWARDPETKLFKLPAGEWHVQGHFSPGHDYLAAVRGSSADDLMAVAVWADAVHREGGRPHLVIPYFPGARQDRRQAGESLSVKVYADFVNSLNFKTVTILDPHSIVTPALIDRVIVHDGTRQAVEALGPLNVHGIIIPDLGAVKRSSAVAEALGLRTFQASKRRNPETGELDGFDVSLPTIGGEQVVTLAICDDIIDGGGTFMGLAETIYRRTSRDNVKLHLYATHGVFSGHAAHLYNAFKSIHTTDSIRETTDLPSDFHIHPTIESIFPEL